MPARAQFAANLETVAAGQQAIEDDQIVVVDRRLIERRLAVAAHVNGISVFAQAPRNHTRHARLIFDEQNPQTLALLTS